MAPQQLATAAVAADSPYTGGPVSSVPEVIARLDQIRTFAEAHEVRGQHDGVACFSFLYQRITTRVFEGLNSGRFTDREFVTLLDVVFANRYLSALRASVVDPDKVPHAWSVLFERRAHRRITPLQFAAAGVNAHVNFDLAVAVVDTCSQLGSEPNAGTKRQSYQEINKIFAVMDALGIHRESVVIPLGTGKGRVRKLVSGKLEIIEALDRLRSGEYEICEVWAGPIAAARLRVTPGVTTCVACQDAEERRARVAPERTAAR